MAFLASAERLVFSSRERALELGSNPQTVLSSILNCSCFWSALSRIFTEQFADFQLKLSCMVLMLDGNSERVAHA